jgi:hypothetical protein
MCGRITWRRYEVQRVGTRTHVEYWIPAEELAEFNRNIVGTIDVIAEYRRQPDGIVVEIPQREES